MEYGPFGMDALHAEAQQPPTYRESILVEAESLVHGARNDEYGGPVPPLTRTARMWSAILGCDVRPEQVGLCMIAMKISRECHRHKRDNLVDIAGYAEIVAWALDEMEKRGERE